MAKHASGRCSAPGLGASPKAVGCTLQAGSVKPLAVPSTCARPHAGAEQTPAQILAGRAGERRAHARQCSALRQSAAYA